MHRGVCWRKGWHYYLFAVKQRKHRLGAFSAIVLASVNAMPATKDRLAVSTFLDVETVFAFLAYRARADKLAALLHQPERGNELVYGVVSHRMRPWPWLWQNALCL